MSIGFKPSANYFVQLGNIRDRRGNIVVNNKRQEDGRLKGLPQTLVNAMYDEVYGAGELKNDVGGYQVPIDTLTQICREVSMQTFYKVPISDYVPVQLGQGAFSQSLLTFKTGSTASQFKQAIFLSGTNSTPPLANTQIQADVLPIINYGIGLTYNIFDLEQTSRMSVIDLISAKEEARKLDVDQGIQQGAFVGYNELGASFRGLVNQDMTQPFHVPVDAGTTLPVAIGSMNETQINTLVGSWVYTYWKNTNFTRYPDKLIMPSSDFFKLSEYITPAFPLENSSRMTILENAFKKQTANANFKILHSIYNQADQASVYNSGLLKDRYILTVDDVRSIKMLIPVPYTTTLFNTVNGYTWENYAFGQISTVQLLKPRETQYYDLA
jgi:hypothetical protein